MASEYLKWKYRDVKPDAPAQYTKRQRAANWWHYHRWWLLAGAALLVALADIAVQALGIGRVEPDYQLAYVASAPLSDADAAALEQALVPLGTDCNGDGRVVFRVNQYVDMADSADGDQPRYAYAANVRLLADLEALESYFFICDAPETLHTNYDILARADGAIAGPADAPDARPWERCPALAALDVPQDDFAGLYLARRGFWKDRVCKHKAECDTLWRALTEDSQ